MNKYVFFIMLCFSISGCVSSSVSSKESSDAINNRPGNAETRIMNPYEYYSLDKTSKIVIRMEKGVDIGPQNTMVVPREKVLIEKDVQKAILTEFNKKTEYDDDFCLCYGDGNIYFYLTDGTKLNFRLKHGGTSLEDKSDRIHEYRRFFPHEKFVKIIRKYYSEKWKKYYDIQDRRIRGEISDEQENQEQLEFMKKYFPGEYWGNFVDDVVMKDEYYKKTIVGSWKILPHDGTNLFAVDTFLPDGEAWYNGEVEISNEKINCDIRSQWKIEDGYLYMTI